MVTSVASKGSGEDPHNCGGGGQNIKKRPQVKTRKWVKKKNELFGWATSVASQGSVKEPHNFRGVGQNTSKSGG